MNNVLAQSEISEIEIAPDKITLIRYNPKTTDCMELANSLSISKFPKDKLTLFVPDDVEISQMSPEEAEGLLLELQGILKEICQRKE